MSQKYFITDWFTLLDPDVELAAVANYLAELTDERDYQCANLSEAICNGFTWDNTPEGASFWLNQSVKAMEENPQLDPIKLWSKDEVTVDIDF